MYAVVTLAVKDLLLLTCNWAGLFWIFVFPLLLALLFGLAFGGSGGDKKLRTIEVAFVDKDKSPAAAALRQRLEKTKALKLEAMAEEDAREAVRKGRLAAFIIVPADYGAAGTFSPKQPPLQLGVDPSQQATAGYLQGMVTEAVYAGLQEQFADPQQFTRDLPKTLKDIDQAKDMSEEQRKLLKSFLGDVEKFMTQADMKGMAAGGPFQGNKLEMVSVTREESGPRSAFEITFPSSILWGILGCVQAFVISIVLERTGGTFLRLRVAPLSWGQVLSGKALACFFSATVVSVVLLFLGSMLFGLRLEHPLMLTLAILSTAACFVGIMMLLSTLGKSVSGVSGASWGILMPLAMIGGGMIPLIAMPGWLLALSNFSPVKWGILALEGAIWRDYTLTEMLLPCGILLGVGAVCFAAGVKKLSWES